MIVAGLPYAAGVPDVGRPILTVVSDEVSDDALSVDELGSRIVGSAGRLAAATCRWLLLVAAFDAREGFARFGLSSTARWLSHYCGLSRRTARDHVRVARTLAAHAGLAGAMGAGRISYSHVRAISRLADLGGASLVANLVMVAEHGTVGQLEDMVRGLRTVDDNQHDPLEAVPEAVSHRWRADSRWGLAAALDPEHGALVQSAIETLARRENITHPQALTRIAEIALAAVCNGDKPVPRLRSDEYAAVVIHLDAAAIPADSENGSAEPPPPLEAVEPVEAVEPCQVAETEQPGRPDRRLRTEQSPGASDAEIAAACGVRVREVAAVRDLITAAQSDPTAGLAGSGLGSAEHPRPWARIADGPGLPVRVIERLLCGSRIRVAIFDPRVPPGQAKTPSMSGRPAGW